MKLLNNFSRRSVPALLAVLIVTLLGGAPAVAQTTAFTYQGRLSDGANAAPTGAYNMRFALFGSAGNNDQIGSTLAFDGAPGNSAPVAVTGGVFAVRLDFGATGFPANGARHLEISVFNPATSQYVTLAPRQALTAAPYAIRTLSANRADALSAACNGCVTNQQINSVAGAKVTGSVADATNAATANTANTAATAGNVTGVVAVANGGTGSQTKNFVDLTTAQTVAGAKTFTDHLRVNGLIRAGSETGTTDAPRVTNSAYSGLVVRRINSFSSTAGNVVARTDYLRLERDGTDSGWRIFNEALPGNERQTIHCLGTTNTGAVVTARLALPNGTTAGWRPLFGNAQNVEYMQCSFGNPYDVRHLTQVTLQRDPSYGVWVGTVTSTFNQ